MSSIDIFLERMAIIVHIEKKPFSYKDFLFFEHEGKDYRFTHGTIRNIFSKLRRNGNIEPAYRSNPTFYTLPGVKLGKPITLNHGEDALTFRQNELLHLIQNIPMDKPAIHDIRLRFECKGLWSILPLYSSDSLIENIDLKSNRDITLYDVNLKDFVIKPTIHKTDTVSIAIACSESPVPLNLEGLAKLTSGLTRIEERLQRVVDEHIKNNLMSSHLSSTTLTSKTPIPHHETWIVTMWHFGQDSLTEYTGERFEISWGDGLKLFRIYSKYYKNKKKMRIRKEIQECPNKPLKDAFMNKISAAAAGEKS